MSGTAGAVAKITKKALRQQVDRELCEAGFTREGNQYVLQGNLDKQNIRDLHTAHRTAQFEKNKAFVRAKSPDLKKHFANGSEINPKDIQPQLIAVTPNSEEADLFRFATGLWSVPVSQGFGRRMRFIVRDQQNGKLIGLFALGDPVFNLASRDQYIDWTFDDRKARLIHVMDAFVVGAVPPYSSLICGKLVAALMASTEVKDAYNKKYLDSESVISRSKKRARLVLITTTSALGRSSLYNRLKIPDGPAFIRVGTTRGFGHFHISQELFGTMRLYLDQNGHPYASANKFGMGPNWRFRVVRTALESVGLNADGVLRHGIEREVYLIPLATNWIEILRGEHKNVRSTTIPADTISNYCLERWVLPRSLRDGNFADFKVDSLMDQVLNNGSGEAVEA